MGAALVGYSFPSFFIGLLLLYALGVAWLMWRLEHHDGETKARKVPYYTNGRRRHGTRRPGGAARRNPGIPC
mgnify:CR=1 FL=1